MGDTILVSDVEMIFLKTTVHLIMTGLLMKANCSLVMRKHCPAIYVRATHFVLRY
jgi:hypothetical protein